MFSKLRKAEGFLEGVPGKLVFLHPVNLVRGVVEGKGFVRPVQALVFLETFPEMFL